MSAYDDLFDEEKRRTQSRLTPATSPFDLSQAGQSGAGDVFPSYDSTFGGLGDTGGYDTWRATERGLNTPEAPAAAPVGMAANPDLASAYDQYLGRSAGPEDYASHASNPSGTAGAIDAVKGSREAQGYSAVKTYQEQVAQLQNERDPVKQAALRDTLARDVFQSLKGAGHDVKWQGDTLIVDGREYTIAGAQSGASGGAAGTATGWGFNSPTGGRQEFSYTPGNYGTDYSNLEGFGSVESTDPAAHGSIKNIFGRTAAGLPLDANFVPAVVRRLNEQGIPARQVGHDQIDFGNGEGPIDVMRGGTPETGYHGVQWIPGGGGAPGMGGTAPGGAGLPGQTAGVGGTQGAGAVTTGSSTPPTSPSPGAGWVWTGDGWVPPDHPSATTAPGGAGPGSPQPEWMDAPTYTPGDVPDLDTSDLSYDAIMNAQGPNYEAPALATGALGADLEDETTAFMQDLLANPFSLDDAAVGKLKAANKDTLADRASLEEQELDLLGSGMGISDSNWLQSEKLSGRRARDRDVLAGDRNIDIQAALTRSGDKRAAGALVDAFNTAQSGRRRGDDSHRLATAQQNIDNQFRTQGEKREAIKLARDTDLMAAAAANDRVALREGLKQKATELGISQDALLTEWILGLMADATQNKGIDVGAQIDREKLSQAGQEFKEDLIFRYAALAQNNQQFGARYGLDVLDLENRLDRDAYDRTFGPGRT